jgi:hypothetical protein
MIKFGKAKNWTVPFCILKHLVFAVSEQEQKRIRSIKKLRKKKSKPKVDVAKTGLFDLGYQSIHFFQKR